MTDASTREEDLVRSLRVLNSSAACSSQSSAEGTVMAALSRLLLLVSSMAQMEGPEEGAEEALLALEHEVLELP